MSSRISFLAHTFYSILENAESYFPGIGKAVAIFYDPIDELIVAKSFNKELGEGSIEDIDISENRPILQKLRHDKTFYEWYNRNTLPFEMRQSETHQLEIFTDLDEIVLLTRFSNNTDGLYDLLFLYFRENTSNFGASRSDIPLGQDQKNIIGFIIYNFINTIININRTNSQIFDNLMGSTRSMVDRYTNTQDELERTQKNYGLSLVDLCQHYLNELSLRHGKVFELDDSAINKITGYQGEINILKPVIENAVLFVSHLDNSNQINILHIKDVHLDFDRFTVSDIQKTKLLVVEDRHAKTILLLDKLEVAAQDLYERNVALTGKNVGQNCPKPITAAAISDALSNHKKIIRYLFDKYPQKWPVIRNYFKPVKNILIPRKRDEGIDASTSY